MNVEQTYYVKTLGEVVEGEVCCCDSNFSSTDVMAAAIALNSGMINEDHPTLGFCFCDPEFHPFASQSAPVIVRKVNTNELNLR